MGDFEEFSQRDRPLRVTTPLGEDKFILTSLSGSEHVSGLFQFELSTVFQGAAPVDFKDILGKSVTAEVEMYATKRDFNGIVKSITQGARVREQALTLYNITIVPYMWLLTRRVDCRIFQNKTTVEIIHQVFQDAGLTDVEDRTMGTYQPREFCVQYYESDFAFVSRLMEFEGIWYFFKHEEGKHTLVLADDKSAFADLEHSPDIQFESEIGGVRSEGRIYEWQKAQEINAGKFSLVDYDFEKPALSLLEHSESAIKLDKNGGLEIYGNPGDYLTPDAGRKIVKTRVEEEEMRTQVVQAKSLNADVRPGYKFNLEDHFADKGQFSVTGVTHLAHQPLEASAGGHDFAYENQFTCIDHKIEYRPARVTPLPTTRGIQTAVVVGASGEEIYTDEYGRVKVQFHWDRVGTKDEKSSCWIRVATYWAGKSWGALHIPRIGQEVIVDFIEGDVDRPLVVGSVYNAQQTVPYKLPDDKTKSTLKSNSSKGGGGSNEIRFEDKKESEEVFFHAEKDLNSVVENSETRKVGTSKADDGSRTTEIYKDETLTVHTGNQKTTVEKGNQSTEIQMGNQSIAIKMGNQTTKLDLGASSTEAMQSITLKVGQNSIVIDQTGVTIKGIMLNFEGQGMATLKSPLTQVKGDGLLICKGGVVLIN